MFANFSWLLRVSAVMLLSSLWGLSGSSQAHAQSLKQGSLTDEAGQLLVGGTVLALPTNKGAVIDAQGQWKIDVEGADSLRFEYVGYSSLTLAPVDLPESGQVILAPRVLNEVVVRARDPGTRTSMLDPRNVESISANELKKAPCCNLGESFETNAAVDVSYRDAATGAREMQVLGLRGIYSQLLIEKRPTLYGLASPIALDLLAGTWIKGIQIGKGATSIQTGASAMAGQVNVELEEPMDGDPLFVNLFASQLGRAEVNVHASEQWNEHHATGILAHGSYNTLAHDRDRDGFYEQPQRQTYSTMLRHKFEYDQWSGQFNLWGVSDGRLAGQTDHDAIDLEGHVHNDELYRIRQANERVEAFAKTAFLGFSRPVTSIGLIAGATYHNLDNSYGRLQHTGQQESAYANLLFSSYLGNTAHTYTVGLSHQYDSYDEMLGTTVLDRDERMSGAYAEYTFDRPATASEQGFSFIGGFRLDHHNIGGWQAVPRVNVKWNPNQDLAIRLSGGRAYRTAQVLAENIRFLPSSRQFIVEGPLDVERSWNYGAAVTQNFRVGAASGQREGQWGLDLYMTQFQNMVLIDQENTLGFTRAYNASGPAATATALASVQLELLPGFDVKLAGKYVHAYATFDDGKRRDIPYMPRLRGLLAADYETPNERWRFNTNLQVIGSQRLPGADAFELFGAPNTSSPLVLDAEVFAMLNAQITFVNNDKLEWYAGAENITNYRQRRAILGAEDPFGGDYFDASRVYAPLMGISPYAGLRYTLTKR